MKAILIICFIAACPLVFASDDKCKSPILTIDEGWIDMKNNSLCIQEMKRQIKKEIFASMQYLAMGAHFSRDLINRPGFAKMFFESASEEREHAIKLISYLLMRGELTKELKDLFSKNVKIMDEILNLPDAITALNIALKLEASVTESIRNVIKACEAGDYNDYHLVDYLTGVFLEEQYQGQREIAGKISTLGKMMNQHGVLGEWMYDKKLA